MVGFDQLEAFGTEMIAAMETQRLEMARHRSEMERQRAEIASQLEAFRGKQVDRMPSSLFSQQSCGGSHELVHPFNGEEDEEVKRDSRHAFRRDLDARAQGAGSWGDRDDLGSTYEEILESVGTPSIYMVRSVRELRAPIVLGLLTFLVFFVQVVFPVFFIANYFTRSNPTLIAPGFHNRNSRHDHDGSKHHKPRRIVWQHKFAIDLSASFFLVFIAWSTWQRRSLSTFLFFMRCNTTSLRVPVLVFGFFCQIITLFSVVLMLYMLFRLEPNPHELLLNFVALEFLVTFDANCVSAFKRQPQLRKLLEVAKAKLADAAEALIANDTLVEIRRIEKLGYLALIREIYVEVCAFRSLELVHRLTRNGFVFVTYGLWLLAATGGHIAHSHVANVMWYVGILKNTKKPESKRPLLRSMVHNGDNGHVDTQYVGLAFFLVTLTYLVVCVFVCFVERFFLRRDQRRKAAKTDDNTIAKLPSYPAVMRTTTALEEDD